MLALRLRLCCCLPCAPFLPSNNITSCLRSQSFPLRNLLCTPTTRCTLSSTSPLGLETLNRGAVEVLQRTARCQLILNRARAGFHEHGAPHGVSETLSRLCRGLNADLNMSLPSRSSYRSTSIVAAEPSTDFNFDVRVQIHHNLGERIRRAGPSLLSVALSPFLLYVALTLV